MLAIVARAASDPNVDVEKMRALLDMQERIIGRQALAEFNAAFARLAGKLSRVKIKRDGTLEYPINKNDPDGPKRKIANFARWENIMGVIGPYLDEEGFALCFESSPRQGDGGGLVVTGTLLHTGGHARTASIPLPLDSSGGKNNLQGYGSTFSYGKRYTATMLLNIVTEGEDDDGVKGAQEFINDSQKDELLALLRETRTELGRWLHMVPGTQSVEEIPTAAFVVCKNSLLTKRAQMQAKGVKP
jgi:hypothetical protein